MIFRKRFDLVGVCAVLVWLGCMVWMGVEWVGDAPGNSLTINEDALVEGFRPGEEWQGLYQGERKVGYMGMTKRMLEGGGGYHVETRMMLRMHVMGNDQEIESVVTGEMGRDFVLRSFEADLEAGPAKMKARGAVGEDGALHLKVYSGGGVQEETLQLKEPPRMSFALAPTLMRHDLKPGEEVAYTYFDPSGMREKTTQVRFEGREKIRVMGRDVEAYHWVQKMGSSSFNVWTNALGEVLRAELPMGLVATRETRSEAQSGVGSGELGEDITEQVAIRPTGGPFRVHAPEARLALSGVDWEGLDLDGGRQTWTLGADGAEGQEGVLEMRVEALAPWRDETVLETRTRALRHSGGAEWLAAELMIQSDNPSIRDKALEVVGKTPSEVEEAPVLAVAREISGWVYATLKKESVVGVPSALETLQTLRGDCNEHATLTVALLRALGVPARIAVGAAWLERKASFLYHAWVEVRVGHEWVAMDPTFGQFPADVGHIRFVTGGLRDQVEMFRVMGKVRVRVLSQNP